MGKLYTLSLCLRQSGVWHSTSSSLNWETESDNNYRPWRPVTKFQFLIFKLTVLDVCKISWWVVVWAIDYTFFLLWILPLINYSIMIEQYYEKTLRANCSSSHLLVGVLQLFLCRMFSSHANLTFYISTFVFGRTKSHKNYLKEMINTEFLPNDFVKVILRKF